MEIKLIEEQVREAFKKAQSDEVKEMLTALFPTIAKELTKKKPTLDDYTTITSYEDACEALGESPIFSPDYVRDLDGNSGDVDFFIFGCERENTEWETLIQELPSHIIALMKLETISRALWGRNWKPKPDAEGSETFYWPWFALWTKEEIDEMNNDKKEALLYAGAIDRGSVGFGCLSMGIRSSNAYFGFRLCQETEEKARYFGGRNFVKLWAEYLQFNFTTGNFIMSDDE